MTIKPSWAVKAALGLLPLSLFAGNAFASVAPMGAAGGGNGDLLLAIIDQSNNNSYEVDLGKTTLGLEGANTSFTFSQSSGTDSALQSFLSAAGSNDQFEFAVVGGAYDSTTSTTTKASANYLTTSGLGAPSSVTNSTLTQFDSMDQNVYTGLNALTASSVNSYYTAASTQPPNFSDSSAATTWFGHGPQNDANVGTSEGLYEFLSTYNSTSGGIATKNTAAAALTQLGTFGMTLSGGAYTLTYDAAGTSPVPLPPAVWLLGSGLLGLAGVGRRRRAA